MRLALLIASAIVAGCQTAPTDVLPSGDPSPQSAGQPVAAQTQPPPMSVNLGSDFEIRDDDADKSESIPADATQFSSTPQRTVSYSWRVDGREVAGSASTRLNVSLGIHTVSLVVTDTKTLEMASHAVTVSVLGSDTPFPFLSPDEYGVVQSIYTPPYINSAHATYIAAIAQIRADQGACGGCTGGIFTLRTCQAQQQFARDVGDAVLNGFLDFADAIGLEPNSVESEYVDTEKARTTALQMSHADACR